MNPLPAPSNAFNIVFNTDASERIVEKHLPFLQCTGQYLGLPTVLQRLCSSSKPPTSMLGAYNTHYLTETGH